MLLSESVSRRANTVEIFSDSLLAVVCSYCRFALYRGAIFSLLAELISSDSAVSAVEEHSGLGLILPLWLP